ncbi:MAG: T9SS type A sorting domain-containing protein [candidate division WOR-3 bacterium]
MVMMLVAMLLTGVEDTVIFYDSGIHRTWWCSDRDSFGAAVRFTPREYPCDVVGSRAEINYDDGQQIYLRVYDDDGAGGLPGTILYNEQRLDVPHRLTPGFRDYDFTRPVTIESGDFYIVWWQKNIWDMVFGTDDHFDSISRQWWYFPDLGWVTPMGMDAADHLIRAKVRYGTGIEECLPALTPRAQIGIYPNPAGDFVTVRLSGFAAGSPVALVLHDVAGRVVLRTGIEPGTGCCQLDVTELPAGIYCCAVWSAGRVSRARLVIQHDGREEGR